MKRTQTTLAFIPVRRNKENIKHTDGNILISGKRGSAEQLQSEAKRAALHQVEPEQVEHAVPDDKEMQAVECEMQKSAQQHELQNRPNRDRRKMMRWCVVACTPVVRCRVTRRDLLQTTHAEQDVFISFVACRTRRARKDPRTAVRSCTFSALHAADHGGASGRNYLALGSCDKHYISHQRRVIGSASLPQAANQR